MPRKTPASQRSGSRGLYASMRPRPDAAENAQGADVVRRTRLASMRPRPDAAENAAVSASDTQQAQVLQ